MGENTYPTGETAMPTDLPNGDPTGQQGTPPEPNQQASSEPDQVSPDVADKGFPAKTPVKDMTESQQIAYWKYQSRQHESRSKSLPPDYEELKQYREAAERAKLSETDRAIAEAREAGRAEAKLESGKDAALAIYQAALAVRGVSADDIAELAEGFNPTAFIKNGDVDIDKLGKLAARHAASATGVGNGSSWPATGQGNVQQPPTSQSAEGLAEIQRRYPGENNHLLTPQRRN